MLFLRVQQINSNIQVAKDGGLIAVSRQFKPDLTAARASCIFAWQLRASCILHGSSIGVWFDGAEATNQLHAPLMPH